MIKDTDEQPDEEIYRARSGRVGIEGASVRMELGYVTLQVHMSSPTWKLSKSHTIGIYGGFLM